MARTRAQQVEDDRKATQAFRNSKPPVFRGGDIRKLQRWMHQISTMFATCHVPERIQVQLASLQMDGEVFHWWVLQHDTPAQDSWSGLCEALIHYIGTTAEREGPAVVMEPVVEEEPAEEHPEEEDPIVGDEAPILMVDFPDMMEPILPWTTEYNLRADSWARKPNESMVDYAERFYQEILSVIPYEETYQWELIYLFWSGVPEPVRHLIDFPPMWADVRYFATSVVKAAGNV